MQIVILFSGFASLLLFFFGLVRYRKLSIITKHVVLLAFVSAVSDSIGRVLWINKMSNVYVLNIYTILEFLIIANIYRLEFRGFVKENLMKYIMGIFVAGSMIDMLFIQGYYQLNSYTKISECFLLVIFAIVYFYKVVTELVILDLKSEPMFWINAAVLMYFVSGSFLFTLSEYIQQYSKSLDIWVWGIHAIFLAVFCATLSVSFVVQPKRIR